ncbi:ATP-binding protein [Glaciecola sp. XM2]|uniref:sensor histidine kinase n=1 Tax=Glaciecola sp. XM2 TaxID=1914931 RepID=UPI0020326260|nr:ATP-binding protein [Glaciecola sp. XM2]
MSVTTRVWIICLLCSLIGLLPVYWLVDWTLVQKLVFTFLVLSLSVGAARFMLKDIKEGLSALEIGLLNMKDGEFSSSLSYQKSDQLGQLCGLYNQTIDKLREEKHWLYQRELLLDKITQSSPDVLLLVNDQGVVIFSNIAARHFFSTFDGISGRQLSALLNNAPQGAADAITANKEGLFSLNHKDKEPETWHMSLGSFSLNNQSHTLYILKQMTRELSRQEVAVWKKVIRVISHELNNSLGPISSMLHSGRILSLQVDEDRLARVFSTIDERIKHLSDFVQGYGKFAKIPEPKVHPLKVSDVFEQLAQQWQFNLRLPESSPDDLTLHADAAQFEQLMINLLKNAHESGSRPEDVSVELAQTEVSTVIKVKDRGKGIADDSLNSVLIPFYSTKSNGTGLGLALCREIIDAHHGQIALYNRSAAQPPSGNTESSTHDSESGAYANNGLVVKVTLPKFR